MTPSDRSVPDAEPLDELASALVDGEATADEQRRASEPEVARRVAAFGAVARRVGHAPAPPDEAARETAIRVALGALDQTPVPLIGRRRRAPRTWLPALGAVAAAALAVVGLGAFVASLGGGDDDDAGTESAATLEATDDDFSARAGGEDGAEAGADAPAAATATPLAALPDLGDVPDPDALAAAIREHAAQRAMGEADEQAATGQPCADRFTATLVPVGTARLDGRPVIVAVAEPPNGPRTFEAFDVDTCDRVAGGEL